MPKWDLYILLQGKKSDEDFTAASIQKTGCHLSPNEEKPLFPETAYARASVQNGDRKINYDIFSEQKRVEGNSRLPSEQEHLLPYCSMIKISTGWNT